MIDDHDVKVATARKMADTPYWRGFVNDYEWLYSRYLYWRDEYAKSEARYTRAVAFAWLGWFAFAVLASFAPLALAP